MRRIVMAVTLAACLGACGGDEEPGVASLREQPAAAGAEASASVDPEQAQLDFAECMRENGVDMPDPAAGPGGAGSAVFVEAGEDFDEAGFRKAEDACRHHLEGVIGEPSAQDMREMEDAALRFAQCMRDNGVENHPDPEFSEDGMTLELSEGIADDPDFEEAEATCRKMLPGMVGPGIEAAEPVR